jgi:threonine dehydrogenase-like Zn-dependent dehydrogenase
MKALVYTAPLELRVEEVDEPRPDEGEVLIRVKSAGICGSELEGVRSRSPFRVPPLVMGHEFGGERVDSGEAVVVNPITSCATCDLCLQGQGNLCRSRAVVGIHRAGGFAELVAVPERNLHPLPPGMSWAQAALVEPVANAVHAWRLVAARTPARVGILGAGPIGLVGLLVAGGGGAAEVCVADLVPNRLEIALQLGASSTGQELSGEFDVVIDAAGVPATRRASVASLRPGGAAVWLGLHSEDPSFAALDLIRGEKAVLGSFAYTDTDFRRAIGIAAAIDPSWVTTFPLERGAEIFMELMNGRADVVKAHLTPA